MVKIINGIFGHYVNGKVVPKDKNSEPLELAPELEEHLVKSGVAVYVNEDGAAPVGFDETPPELPELPEGVTAIPEYSVDMKATELREIGAMCGLTFKVGMTKAEMVAALDKHIEENTVEGVEVNEDGEITVAEDEDAPNFDAADAVVE